MNKDKIQNTWPDSDTEKALLGGLERLPESCSYEGTEGIKKAFYTKAGIKKNHRRKNRKPALLLAAAMVLCAVSVTAASRFWHLSDPGTYTGNYIKVNETKDYVYHESESAFVLNKESEVRSETETTEASDNEDQIFIALTKKILEIAADGKTDIFSKEMKLSYQKNENWNREEVFVSFQLNGELTSVTFDRKSQSLLSLDFWVGENKEEGRVMDEDSARACAESWYEKLPFNKGYVYNSLSKFDDHAWMYDFSKEITLTLEGKELTLKNNYETTRITIDPTNGAIILANSFYVPLLDDHKEEDLPLTKEEALKACADYLYGSQDIPENIEITERPVICLPAYDTVRGSALKTDVSYRYDSVTRLAWMIRFDQTDSEYGCCDVIEVDLYTGEILRHESI